MASWKRTRPTDYAKEASQTRCPIKEKGKGIKKKKKKKKEKE